MKLKIGSVKTQKRALTTIANCDAVGCQELVALGGTKDGVFKVGERQDFVAVHVGAKVDLHAR